MSPSLVALCLRLLARCPDQLHALPVRLHLRDHLAPALLADLVPDPAAPDPNVWAVLVQLYSPLPAYLAVCPLPLYAPQLPLLQAIPPSDLFSLVTVLDLSATQHLTDETIHQLRFLHLLTALDASTNPVSAYAIRSLAATVHPNDDLGSPRRHRGPGELRILALRSCKRVNNDVYRELDKFPLLSVVDLRGTTCTRYVATKYKPCPNESLYYPFPLRDSLDALQAIQPQLYASQKPYTISINKLNPPETTTAESRRVGAQDSFVVFSSNYTDPIKIGNTHVYSRQVQAREEHDKHEKNKTAWYDRQEIIEEKMLLAEQQAIMSESSLLRTHGGPSCENASTRLPKPHGASKVTAASLNRRSMSASDRAPVARIPSVPPATGTATATALSVRQRRTSALQRSHLSAASHTSEIPGKVDKRSPVVVPLHRKPLTFDMPNASAIGHRAPGGGQVSPPPPLPPPRLPPTFPKAPDSRVLSRFASPSFQAHLKLLRPPPLYAALDEALTERERSANERHSARDEVALRGGASVLSGVAGKDEARGRKMKEAMEAVLHGRIRPARDGIAHPPEFVFETDPTDKKVSTGSTSSRSMATVLASRRLSELSTSFQSSGSSLPATPVQAPRSRNPFRKRASYPDMPSFGEFSKAADASVSTGATPAQKEKVFSNTSPLGTGASASSSLRRQASLVDVPAAKPSAAKNAVSIKGMYPPDAKPNTKPLIPISSVKVPVLTEEMRKHALMQEAVELAKMSSKKRTSVLCGDGEDEDSVGEERSLSDSERPPAKKRAIAKGRLSTSSILSSKGKEKGKEKAKKNPFDWSGWSKNGGA